MHIHEATKHIKGFMTPISINDQNWYFQALVSVYNISISFMKYLHQKYFKSGNSDKNSQKLIFPFYDFPIKPENLVEQYN